ncbi:MAG: ImmA/IrrE family metallo-endopeptidase, partial [Candidatus ainarchaeum sp.]|nr:ImmA/IrrE family metallo-endopeptidase [Candidatus ainarchaeum sp.]
MTDENYRINPNRLNYLLDQYKLEVSDLASRLTPSNKKRDVFIQQINDVLNDKIKVELKFIKKLDTIFEKGLNWYILNTDIKIEPTKSIFFRKPNIAVESDIIFESKKIVTAFEEKKFELLYLSKLINYNLDRKLNRYTSDKLPINVANEMVNKFAQFSNIKINKATQNKDRDKAYLEYLIRIIEQYNVFVFEFIEAPNKKNPVNYNGFLISPNVIVLKREKSYRREIFTLLHEFAHYLLDLEAIDDVDIEDIKTHSEQEK